jgi:site-specific DNA recombinase
MTSAAVYARVSSARQAKDETIGSQLAALREHAGKSRLDVPEEWVFADEGHSGATLIRPGLEALRDLASQGCLDIVLVWSPDRLARKFAYQALLIEELARCGTRVEFVKGPRGDSPEDQLLVQFQGMFAEYEKAQLAERYRRGKAWRAKTGSVNVLSGAPFGYRYVRKTPESGARYEVVPHQAALVTEMFRRYADDGAAIADLRRWLTDQGVRTRTGKERWDRSVIWGMLRNPAYAGTAVFGKTQAVHEPAGLNRTARLAGRTVPRQVRVQDRPREEWTAIPVPALVDEDTFDRVQQRLADNKRYASRNSKVPSLLQGLAACSSCGYGYYRTSTTTSAGNKIYYYRCLGSDDYRYQGGRVCGNKPVRADYADAVVWDHVTGLLADPALIRAEIGKRTERARTSDPVTRKRGQLEQALARTSKSIAAMVTAFSEQLITIDELRARMPDLRGRETGLKDQIAALDAQAADRDAYLKLADDLEGFLARLRTNSATATTKDRQRVLRAVVQDILIGPEKLTIRHRIPVREPSSRGGHHNTTDTEGDMRESSLLCWGRDHPALRGPGRLAPDLAVLHHPGAQHRAQQLQDRLVADPLLHRLHELLVRDRREAGSDVCLHHPPPAPRALIGEHLQGVVRRQPGPEPEAARQEPRLEDRLEHDLQRGLHDAVTNSGNRQRPLLRRARLGYQHPPGRQRTIPLLPKPAGQLVQQPGDPVLLDPGQGGLVDARCAVVAAHHDPRAPQNVTADDLVRQRVESPPGISLGRPVKRMLQGTNRIPGDRGSLRGGTSHDGTHRAPPDRHCAPTKQRPFPPRRLCCPAAQPVLRPPPTPTRPAIHFPGSPVIGRHAPAANPQAAGPGRASPVPAATLGTFRAPYAGEFLTAALQALRRFHGLRPDSERLGTPLPAPKDG